MFAWRAFPSRGDRASGPAGPEHGPAGPGAFLTVPSLWQAGIRAAFTTRLGGGSDPPWASLNMSFVSGDDPVTVRANRARVLGALGAPGDAWTSGRQVHGARTARVTASERGRGAEAPTTTIPDTDALWTDEPGTALAILTADCIPVLLADPRRRAIGVAHAGWRGLVEGVIGTAVAALGDGASLAAYVGPAIGPCCYEVGDDVASAARDALGDEVVPRADRLDLWRGALVALRRAGVARIEVAALCTRCEPHRFYSHRAGDTGRQGLVAYLADDGR